MSCECCDLLEARVFPHYDLIEGVPVGRHDLVGVLGEHQVTHLTACIDRVDRLESEGIPEFDASVSSASSCCEESMLVGAPPYSLDCCRVLREFS